MRCTSYELRVCWVLKLFWNILVLASPFTALVGHGYCQDSLEAHVVKLPAFRVKGEQAAAHVQGIEVVGQNFFVTARRDDVKPRQPLLLRFDSAGTNLLV